MILTPTLQGRADRSHILRQCFESPSRKSNFSCGNRDLLLRHRSLSYPVSRSICCSASSSPCVPTLPQTPVSRPGHAKVAVLFKSVCIAAAFYAWFKISFQRPGPLFASALASQPSRTGLRTAGGSAWAGLAAGCLHSLSGPDHLAALTPLTLGRTSAKASLLGAWWGFGHCIGQLLLGLLMLFLKDRFNNMLPFLNKYSSLTIGLTLLTIGALGLYETLSESPVETEMAHESPPLALGGAAGGSISDATPTPQGLAVAAEGSEMFKGFSLWTLATGVVYGLQPDALFVVIPALALPTKLAAAAYMTMFVAGTVTAMGSYTAIIGATSKAVQSRGGWLKVEKLSALASLVAVVMGLTIIFGGNISVPLLSHVR